MRAPFVYVANSKSNQVSVIDTATNQVVATMSVGNAGLRPPAASPDGKHVYVPDLGSDMIWVIDTARNAMQHGIQVGRAPNYIAVSPDGKTAYVTNFGNFTDLGAGTVSVIDTAKSAVVNTIQVGPSPQGVVFAGDGKRAYVARAHRPAGSGGAPAGSDGAVVVVDTENHSVVDTITINGAFAAFPPEIAITPDGKQVYTPDGSSINVIDTASNKVVATVSPKIDESEGQVVPGLGSSSGMAVTPNGKFLYATLIRVSNPQQAFIWVIDTTTNTVVVPELWTGTPSVGGVAVTPDGKRVYVATQGRDVVFDSVLIIDTTTNTVVNTVRVETAAGGIVMAPPP
jgi:YVTN family beta-propeller protein